MSKPTFDDDWEIARHIGQRLREARQLRELTQGEVSKRMQISYQQIQKYEAGKNRLAASKLYMAAKAMSVSPLFFFEGLPDLPQPLDIDPDLIKILLKLQHTPNAKQFIKVLHELAKILPPHEE